MKVLFEQCKQPVNKKHSTSGMLAPPFFDTINIKDGKKDWVEDFVRKATIAERKENPDLKLPSVKCDVYTTAIVALSLVIFPQQPNTLADTGKQKSGLQRTKSGRADLSNEHNHRFIFATGQNSPQVTIQVITIIELVLNFSFY